MTSKVYVYAPTAQGYRLAGRAQWQDKQGAFEYATDWLNASQAYALDPRNLPLVDRVFTTQANEGVFGVLADAGPDAWGRRVIDLNHRQKPANPLEYLISGNGDGVGALRFSLSRSALGKLPNHLAFRDVDAVATAERLLDEGQLPSEADMRMVWEAGSSMGGARPKFTVGHGNDSWLVKVARKDDPVDMAILEHACLQVAQAAGLAVPESKVVTLGQRSALLVRRFDRESADTRVHYLSAHALLNLFKMGPQDVVAPMGLCTYGGIASLSQHAMGLACGPALFQRMIFNVMLGNTDDHGRNLGFMKPLGQPWQLAPAFDLTVVGDTSHALGLGHEGRKASLDNACSDLGRFHVCPAQALEVIAVAADAVRTLPQRLLDLGAGSADVQWTKQRLPALSEVIPSLSERRSRRRVP